MINIYGKKQGSEFIRFCVTSPLGQIVPKLLIKISVRVSEAFAALFFLLCLLPHVVFPPSPPREVACPPLCPPLLSFGVPGDRAWVG